MLGFKRLKDWWQRRSGVTTPARWLLQMLNSETKSGVSVDAVNAMWVPAVYACVKVLAESVASLPLHVYRRGPGNSREIDRAHPLYGVLHDQPNRWQTSLEFREMMMGHLLLRGNAFALLLPGSNGSASELWPLNSARMKVQWNEEYRLSYEYTWEGTGQPVPYAQDQIFHIRGLTTDGMLGLSPIAQAKEAIGLAMATERHGATVFGNQARFPGFLTHPGPLSPGAKKNFQDSLKEEHGGDKANTIPILEEGIAWTNIGMPNDDAQFLETRKYQSTEICRIFRVPPHMIADLERATFSNIEHQAIDFVVHSLRPWLVRWEQAILRDLMPDQEEHYAEFLVDGLLRGDARSRTEALKNQFMHGALTLNQWCAIENRNPLDGDLGDKHYVPANLKEVTDEEEEEPEPQPIPPGLLPPPEKDEEGDEVDKKEDERSLQRAIAREIARRIVAAEVKEIDKRGKHAATDRERFNQWVTAWFDGQHAERVRSVLSPFAEWCGDSAVSILTTGRQAMQKDYHGKEPDWNDWQAWRTKQIETILIGAFNHE